MKQKGRLLVSSLRTPDRRSQESGDGNGERENGMETRGLTVAASERSRGAVDGDGSRVVLGSVKVVLGVREGGGGPWGPGGGGGGGAIRVGRAAGRRGTPGGTHDTSQARGRSSPLLDRPNEPFDVAPPRVADTPAHAKPWSYLSLERPDGAQTFPAGGGL
ncbi:hypothetical protein AAFF_G00154210 [Aldrovandia affinis]|uniref:Uncharacterized protein n=1 Tax=Aldrovandia affinis TaxID=143900 RepID=A0AAD7T0G9_9TELE|nr:hypothetical protein AAFF_G00154210 [Aldrovandia affinis]